MDGVLVRFGELGIKSTPVRRQMTGRLQQNLHDAMLAAGVEGKASVMGSRLWLTGDDVDKILAVATKTFGVVSASPCKLVESTMESMAEVAVQWALDAQWETFAIRARREGKHVFSSKDVGMQVGSAVFTAAEKAGRNPKVNLSNPDYAIDIDVRGDRAYMHIETVPGPGGLPKGSQGRVAVLVSDAESMVAAWFMMRRGCKIVLIHGGNTGSIPEMEPLQAWGAPRQMDILPICQGYVEKPVFLEAAWEIAKRARCDALVLGDTLDSELVVVPGVPILRPVCGLAKQDVEALQETIGFDDEPEHIFAESKETVESVLSMHRVVDC